MFWWPQALFVQGFELLISEHQDVSLFLLRSTHWGRVRMFWWPQAFFVQGFELLISEHHDASLFTT
jgi:hypothetical protein